MTYYSIVFTSDLYHHGVKGQKWGERQYQYKDGSLTPLGRIHYGVGSSRKRSSNEQANSSSKVISKSDSKEKHHSKIDKDKLKTAAIIAGVAAVTVASIYVASKTGALDKISPFVGDMVPRPVKLDGLIKTASLEDAQETAWCVNPNYEKGKQYQNNCWKCSITSIFRQKGYNVEARGDVLCAGGDPATVLHSFAKPGTCTSWTINEHSDSNIFPLADKFFKRSDVPAEERTLETLANPWLSTPFKSYADTYCTREKFTEKIRQLTKDKETDVGIVCVNWLDRDDYTCYGGHAFNYIKFKNGVIHFFDSQCKEYGPIETDPSIFEVSFAKPVLTSVTSCGNIEFRDDVNLGKIVKNKLFKRK